MTRKLRILAISYDYRPRLGGVATCSYGLLRELSRMSGVELKLLARRMPGDAEFDERSEITTRRLKLPDSPSGAVLPLALAIARECVAWKPDAVLNMLWHPSGLASTLAAPVRLPLRVPYFVFAHGVEILESDRNLRKRVRGAMSGIKKTVLKGAAAVFAVSRFTAGLVEACGVDRERIRVVHNGVDAEEFYPAPKAQDLVSQYGLEGKRVLLTTARLDDYKGIDRAIASLRYVKREIPDVMYLVCGEGKDRNRLETIARHYGVRENVIFAGAVSFERLRDYYNLCETFVMLTRFDREAPNVEGFGIVFLEAAACGKPSIGGKSGGIGDVIEPGLTGWLVDPYDDRAIADAMIEALSQPERTAEMGGEARSRAIGQFSWKRMAENVLAEIERKAGPRVRD